MIAVDSSAIIAIALNEPEKAAFRLTLKNASKVFVSAVSVIETRIVMYNRNGHAGVVLVNDILNSSVFEIVPPGIADMEAVYQGFITFGKGNGHPAQLNFGDLFSYALAKVRGVPLLFKGNDFAKTDIEVAL